MPRERILIVEDEKIVAQFVQTALERFGYAVSGHACSGEEAISEAESSRPDLVLMDIRLSGKMDGVEAAKQIRFGLDIPVVYLTGSSDGVTLERAKRTEAVGFILKPFQPEHLHTTIEMALYQYREARKRSENALRQAELKYQSILENAVEGIFQISPAGRYIAANSALARMLGYESAAELIAAFTDIGRQLYVDPERRADLQRLLGEAGAVKGFEAEVYRKDGSKIWISQNTRAVLDTAGQLLCYEGIIEDITQRRQEAKERELMELQLRQAQKLEAVGQLAAGIAHEINTPTQYVSDNTRFLQGAFDDLERVLKSYDHLTQASKEGRIDQALVDEVEAVVQAADLEYLSTEIPKAIAQSLEGVERVSTIVRAMKEFSHPGSEEKQLIDLNRAIESTLTVARNEWKYVAEMVTQFDPELPSVPCLPGEFNQVILNLIINASHAVADMIGNGAGEKGTITVRTLRSGNWAEVRISDTGTGIPEHARDHIFDPFFTTKEVGKGTGQGLAISHAVIVGKHAGTIAFETEMGKGTTFIIRLPLDAF